VDIPRMHGHQQHVGRVGPGSCGGRFIGAAGGHPDGRVSDRKQRLKRLPDLSLREHLSAIWAEPLLLSLPEKQRRAGPGR
jgi:hypothetical protein